MTDIVRNIVREELSKALEHFNPAISDIEDDIIHNFEAGRSFGINNLSKSIKGLDNYHMSDYFPKSEMKEGWIFEVDNHYGGAQIEIIHELGGDHYGS